MASPQTGMGDFPCCAHGRHSQSCGRGWMEDFDVEVAAQALLSQVVRIALPHGAVCRVQPRLGHPLCVDS
eukprot:1247182-Amphidinium_carterae.1